MGNTYKLIWSEEALNNLKDIIGYLENKWTQREIKKFARLLEKHLDLIKDNPKLFPESELSNGFRRAVISKQVSLYRMNACKNLIKINLLQWFVKLLSGNGAV